MNRFAYSALLISVCGVFGLLALASPTVARADEKAPVKAAAKASESANDPEREHMVDIDNNIYDTQEAYDLVAEARKCDNMSGNFDRDKAVELYEKAIAAQPGAKLNGELANRIGGMYAFNRDPKKGIEPDRVKARE